MAGSCSRMLLEIQRYLHFVVGLLDCDEQTCRPHNPDCDGEDYLDDDFDAILFPGSDDELGFEEVEIRHGSDSESEEEQDSDR